jgi:acetyltransferase-like isoleucine patch superfamily enzyme
VIRIIFDNIKILRQVLSNQIRQHKKRSLIEKEFSCKIDSSCVLSIQDISKLQLSEGVSIGAFTVINVSDNALRKSAFLSVGKNTYIGEHNNIRAAGGKITIGSNCLISQNVQIIAANHEFKKDTLIVEQPWSSENNFIDIGNDVWLGCGVIVLPGVKIGNGAVVGAGSVVTGNLPDDSIALGAPARVVKNRT